MLTPILKRSGIVLSAVWVLFGGYYLYLQNSHQDHWNTVRSICAFGDQSVCSEMTAEANELFPPDWFTISGSVIFGLILIWAALFAVSWIQRGKLDA
jgi:hypothetical protein